MVSVENNDDERRVLFVIYSLLASLLLCFRRETEPHFIDHNFYRGLNKEYWQKQSIPKQRLSLFKVRLICLRHFRGTDLLSRKFYSKKS